VGLDTDQALAGNERSKPSSPSRPPRFRFDANFLGTGLTLFDLDAALNVSDVLPPVAELARLDPGSYKLRHPGGEAWVRLAWPTS
jgi:hypothetical protein